MPKDTQQTELAGTLDGPTGSPYSLALARGNTRITNMVIRVAIEVILLLAALGLGMIIWIAVAFHHDDVTDEYWSVHGVPPPPDYAPIPNHLMLPIIFGPLTALLFVRLGVWAFRSLQKRR